MCLAERLQLFVANHKHMPGYTWDFVVQTVHKIPWCLQARNKLNIYIYDNHKQSLSIFSILIEISKGCKSNQPNFPWDKVSALLKVQTDQRSLTTCCLQFTLTPEYVIIHFYFQLSKLFGRHLILVFLQVQSVLTYILFSSLFQVILWSAFKRCL